MSLFLTVLHVMACLVLIIVVLLQRGKGAEIGAVFGGGASTTVFGSRGAGNFLTKLTTGSAILFMITSLGLSYLGGGAGTGGLFEGEPAPAPEESPFQESGEPAAPTAPGDAASGTTGGFAPVEGAAPSAPGPAPAPAAEAAAPEAKAAAPQAPAPAPSTP